MTEKSRWLLDLIDRFCKALLSALQQHSLCLHVIQGGGEVELHVIQGGGEVELHVIQRGGEVELHVIQRGGEVELHVLGCQLTY